MKLHTKQEMRAKRHLPLEPTEAPASPQSRTPLAIALFLGALVPVSRAQLPLPDNFDLMADREVTSLALQADGKILAGGYFTTLGGQPRDSLARLNPDGTLDSAFNPGATRLPGGGGVRSLILQTDGKILVGGFFDTLGGQQRNSLGRLNPDGTLDATFDPKVGLSEGHPHVFCLALQADGKILVGGSFDTLGGQPRNGIGRLNPDGTVDPAFSPEPGAADSCSSMALQEDGRILTLLSIPVNTGARITRLSRLNSNGTLDSTFNSVETSANSLAVQSDGKILVGGHLGGPSLYLLVRVDPDGTYDATFGPELPVNDWDWLFVSSLTLQADGKILVGLDGDFSSYISRLNPDGTADSLAWAYEAPTLLTLQADGKILVHGRLDVGRLDNTGPATEVLSLDGSTITWMRGGASPEVWRTTFEHSVDGLTWTFLGAGTRMQGGWELAGVPTSPESILRARGFVAGRSGWFVETKWIAPPVLIGWNVMRDGVDVTVTSVAGRSYTLQTSTTLDSWVDVPGAVGVTGTGAALVLHHASPERHRSFYRVVAR